MADDTTGMTGRADASNNQSSPVTGAGVAPTGAPASAIPEPQILEEHIVRRTTPKTAAKTAIAKEPPAPAAATATPKPSPIPVAAPTAPAPTPLAEPVMTAIDTAIVAPESKAAPIVEVTKPPAPVVPISETPVSTVATPAKVTPALAQDDSQSVYGVITPPPGFEPAPLPRIQTMPSVPPVDSAPRTMPAESPMPVSPAADQPRDNFTQILKEVKLPDRHDYTATGEAKKPEQKVVQIPTALGESRVTPPVAEPTPAEAASAAAPTEPEALAPVHTLKNDLQTVVKDQNISLVRAAALEQEKRRPVEETPEPRPRSGRSFGMIFTILLLLFLGTAALAGVYFVAQQQSGIPESTPSTSIVFAEQTVAFPVGSLPSTAIRAQLAQARTSSNAALGSIVRIVPTKGETADGGTPMTFSEFMDSIDAKVPEGLVRALGDNFFFGLHSVDENAPIIVVPVVSYDRAFAGMLEWEKTMNASLAPIFTPVSRLVTGSDGIPTERPFTDFVMRNYDTRVLKDDSGTIQLYYAFPTRELLVIAESPYSFTEILSRLQAERRL